MDILVAKLWALACFLVIQGSVSVNLVGEGIPDILSHATALVDISPIGTTMQPPLAMPPLNSPPTPEMPEGPISSTPTVSSVPPSHLPGPPPMNTEDPAPVVPATPPPEDPQHSSPPPIALPPPAIAIAPPPDKPDVNTSAPAPAPPSPNQTNPPESNAPPVPVAPVSNTPPSPSMLQSPPPYHPVLPNEPPSLPPVSNTPPSPSMPQSPPPSQPVVPNEPPSLPPVSNTPPSPSIPQSPPPYQPVLPNEPPSLPPEPTTSVPPAISRNAPPPVKPQLPVEHPPSPPEQNAPPAISRNVPPPFKQPLPVEPPSSPPEQNVPPAISRNVSPPVKPTLPVEPPSIPPEQNVHPALPRHVSPPVQPPVPHKTHSSPPEQNVPPAFAPPPSIRPRKAITPLPAPHTNKSSTSNPPVSHSPSKGPPPSKPVSNSTRSYNISPAPSFAIPPASSKPAHMNHSKSAPTPPHNAPPPTDAGSPTFPTPNISPSHSRNIHHSPAEVPYAPPPWPGHADFSPKLSPHASSPRHPKMRSPSPPPWQVLPPPPWQVLPPPPPQKDCAPLVCTDPLTYGPPEYPCVCVLPIQVELRLSVALYTFFPLVSELAAEIAAGVFMKPSQVRIMGANAAEDNPDKTIVLVDLVPIGKIFDDTTAYLTFQRLWQKQVPIKPSIFGDYDVLYVRYPGLPPSPPLPPSATGILSKPYPGHSTDPQKPIGVDARENQRRRGLTGVIMATILLSAFVVAILLCVIAWILVFRHSDCAQKPDPTPPNTARSMAKSSAVATSMVGSGPSSPAFSLGSSIVGYTGSTRTFSSTDIETATDNFDELRVLGEGGFGRVYSGVLEDGTKIAVKILKRYDQQGNREFLAEVEMLTRLHHRNLVKLIGICTEARTRCLVYELITNGSVDSHLHGIDKEVAPLDWSARLKIALGAARALAYLHEDSSPRVIHRDFKASNILLEDDYTPKVSDFGLARTALDGDNKHISTRVMGTFGYVAPEYAMTGHLLVKSDVYSYGVVLLELLTGRKPVDMSQPPGQENLVAWARPLLTTQEGLQSMIDPYLRSGSPFDSIAKVSAIASMCVQPEVSHRPFMGEVVQALKFVSNECDRMKELLLPRSSTLEDLPRSSTNSDQMPDHHLLNQSPGSSYDYRFDGDRDLTMSELLSSSAQYNRQDSNSFRRHSSSGPIRTGRTKQLWKTIGRLSGGSVSEHGVKFRLWPGSH